MCFEENFASDNERKQTIYYTLKVDLQANRWWCQLWPVQHIIGVVDDTSLYPLYGLCKASYGPFRTKRKSNKDNHTRSGPKCVFVHVHVHGASDKVR